MARKPNYDFERREREKLKAEKAAQKAARKQKDAEDAAAAEGQETSGQPVSPEVES